MPKETLPAVQDNTPVLPNYEGVKYLSWLTSDHNNVQQLCGSLFRGGYDPTDPQIIALTQAALNALGEVQSDITQLQAFLAPNDKK